jgi:hypothetical protein
MNATNEDWILRGVRRVVLAAISLGLYSGSVGCSTNAVDAQPIAAPVQATNIWRASDGRFGSDEIIRARIVPNSDRASQGDAQRFDLGTVRQGADIHRTLVVENCTSGLLTIDRFKVSCDCLTISGFPAAVPPGATVPFKLKFDGSNEKEFHGGLRIEVDGYSHENRILQTVVLITFQ